jgi:hypothetical protein
MGMEACGEATDPRPSKTQGVPPGCHSHRGRLRHSQGEKMQACWLFRGDIVFCGGNGQTRGLGWGEG